MIFLKNLRTKFNGEMIMRNVSRDEEIKEFWQIIVLIIVSIFLGVMLLGCGKNTSMPLPGEMGTQGPPGPPGQSCTVYCNGKWATIDCPDALTKLRVLNCQEID